MSPDPLERLRGQINEELARLCDEHPERSGEFTTFGHGVVAILDRLADSLAGDVDRTVSLAPADAAALDTISTPAGAGSYEERSELGRGGMGVVLEVWDQRIQRPLAMKVLLNEGGAVSGSNTTSGVVARFLREARITGQLSHPGIVPVHEIGKDPAGRVYFTMQVVAGKSLKEELTDARSESETSAPTRFLGVLVRVCETLSFAHSRGVIHRDLKPANIMVGRFGEVYLMDWGLAKVIRETDELFGVTELDPGSGAASESSAVEMTIDGAVIGTPMYMPPEQAMGHIDVLDERSDVYSLGAILYELIAERAPYRDQEGLSSPMEIVDAVRTGPPTALHRVRANTPPELLAICEKAMARGPDDRYQSAEEMREDLRAFLDNRVVEAYRTGALVELRKWIARNRSEAAAIGAAAAIAIAAFVSVAWVQSRRATDLEEYSRGVEEARGRTEQALREEEAAHRRSQGLYLAAQSTRVESENPGLALRLALESHRELPSVFANSSILRSLRVSHEISDSAFGLDPKGSPPQLSPRGDRFAYARTDGAVVVADFESGATVSLLVDQGRRLDQLTFHPDGQRIATSSSDGTACVWDAESGRLLTRFTGHLDDGDEPFVASIAFSPDGSQAVSAGRGVARIWRPDTGEEIRKLRGHDAAELIHGAVYSPDGSLIVTHSHDRTARIYNTAVVDLGAVIARHEGWISTALFDPTGRFVLTLDDERNRKPTPSMRRILRVWNVLEGREEEPRRHEEKIVGACFTPDGRKIISATSDGIFIWDTDSGECTTVNPLGGGIPSCIAIRGDGAQLLEGRSDGTVRIWDLESIAVARVLRAHDSRITSALFTRDGRGVLTSSFDGTVRAWRTNRHHELSATRVGGEPRFAEVSADGRLMVAAVLNARSATVSSVGDPRPSIVLDHAANIAGVELRAEQNTVVTWDKEKTARVWDIESGRLRSTIGPVSTRSVSRDARFLMGIGSDGRAQRWGLEDGTLSSELRGEGRFEDATWFFSPDGQHAFLVSKSSDRLDVDVDVYSFSKPELVKSLKSVGFGAHVSSSPTGDRFLILRFGYHSLSVHETATGERIRELTGHTDTVWSAVFSGDGRWIVTASKDGTARLYSTTDASEDRVFRGHEAPITTAHVDYSGTRIVTRSPGDHSSRLWDARTTEEIDHLEYEAWFRAEFGRTGQYLFVHYQSGIVQVVNARTGDPVLSLGDKDDPIRIMDFTDDEQWLLTATQSGVVQLSPTDPAAYARQFNPRELSYVERVRHQVGTPEEREEYRRTSSFRLHIQELRLIAKSIAEPNDSPGRVLPVLRRRLKDITDLLAEDFPVDKEIPRVAAFEAKVVLERDGTPDPEALQLLATIQEAAGDLDGAVDSLETAAKDSDAPAEIKTKLEELRAARVRD